MNIYKSSWIFLLPFAIIVCILAAYASHKFSANASGQNPINKTTAAGSTEPAHSSKPNPDAPLGPSKQNVRVMAHYMPWFKRQTNSTTKKTEWSHWQWSGKGTKHNPDNVLKNGQRDIASVFYPTIKPYDSHDPNVIEYHILTAKLAGIEAFMCNWYGPDSFTDKAVALMLPIAEKHDFKIGICLEEKAIFPPYSNCKDRIELVAEFQRHLKHVLTKHSTSAAFLKQNNQPLLFVFNAFGKGILGSNLLTPSEITQARKGLSQHLLIRNQLDAKQFPACDGLYTWCGEKTARDQHYQQSETIKTKGNVTFSAACASPGFDDTGVHGWGNVIRKTDRRGTDEYTETWQQAVDSKMDAVQIVTWNDFEEGTPIEPTVEFKFQFVDQTELEIEKLTGRSSNLKDNDLGLAIYQLRKSANDLDPSSSSPWQGKIDKIAKAIFKIKANETREQIRLLNKEIEGAKE